MNARIRWLRTQWPTSTTMLEIPVYLLVFAAMGFVSLGGYVSAERHLHIMDAVHLMAGPRTAMMEYRAVMGVWPTSNGQAGFSGPKVGSGPLELHRVSSVEIREGGAIDSEFSQGALKGKILSIRAWESPGRGLPVAWICGRASTPPGTAAAAPDRTTLSSRDLPSPCRGHR